MISRKFRLNSKTKESLTETSKRDQCVYFKILIQSLDLVTNFLIIGIQLIEFQYFVIPLLLSVWWEILFEQYQDFLHCWTITINNNLIVSTTLFKFSVLLCGIIILTMVMHIAAFFTRSGYIMMLMTATMRAAAGAPLFCSEKLQKRFALICSSFW